MRKSVTVLMLLLTFVVLPITASAHPGQTDSSGGHHVRSTGEYHYHHGYTAHQHTGGICPYSFNDRTNQSSGSNSKTENGIVGNSNSNHTKDTVTDSDAKDKRNHNNSQLWTVMIAILFIADIVYIFWYLLRKRG